MSLPQETLERIYVARDNFIKQYYGKEFYPYQRLPSNAIIRAALEQANDEFYVEISRQSGKTEMVVLTLAFLIIMGRALLSQLGKTIHGDYSIVIGAPQQEQSKTDFSRLKDYLEKAKADFGFSFEESNGTTLKVSNGTIVYCFPVTVTSKIESKTAHLIIGEEMQDVPDPEWDKKIVPMGTSTNASKVLIGTAGYHECQFHKGIEGKKNAFVYDCYEVIKQRRARYEEDGDEYHLNYEKYVQSEIARKGEENPEIKSQYFLEWQLERGMWLTREKLDELLRPELTLGELPVGRVVVGIDVAKDSDVTFCTALVITGQKEVKRRVPSSQHPDGFKEESVIAPTYRVVDYFMISGVLYQDQWEAIDSWLERLNPWKINIDSTGVGDATADYYIGKYNRISYEMCQKLESKGIRYLVRGVKFTPQSKHVMFNNLEIAMNEGRLEIPDKAPTEPLMACLKRFKIEALSALREWRGSLLNVRHPDRSKGESGDVETDDSVDSLALCFFDPDTAPNDIQVRFV